jgi:hypothetical protein
MTDRPASWRMPTPKQMERLAAAAGRNPRSTPNPGPGDPMPAEYWDALLGDPRAGSGPAPPAPSLRALRLSEIPLHVLRVSCSRWARIIEIHKADGLRLYGRDAGWKQVGQRVLDYTRRRRLLASFE